MVDHFSQLERQTDLDINCFNKIYMVYVSHSNIYLINSFRQVGQVDRSCEFLAMGAMLFSIVEYIGQIKCW